MKQILILVALFLIPSLGSCLTRERPVLFEGRVAFELSSEKLVIKIQTNLAPEKYRFYELQLVREKKVQTLGDSRLRSLHIEEGTVVLEFDRSDLKFDSFHVVVILENQSGRFEQYID